MIEKRMGIKAILLALILSFIGSANATHVSGLYSAQIPVTSQSNNARQKAIEQGLLAVLVKVTGNSHVIEIPAIINEQQNAVSYVQSYRYAIDPKTKATSLNIHFNGQSIRELLNQNHQAIWKENRPTTLIWFIIKKEGQSEFVNRDNHPELTETLENFATARGIPVLFPMLDMTDLGALNSETPWSMDPAVLQTASNRYAPDHILMIRLDHTKLNSDWVSIFTADQTNRQHWEIQKPSLEEILTQGFNQAADNLAEHFVSTDADNSTSTIQLVIDHLTNIQDYTNLMRYLRQLTGVTRMDVTHIDPHSVTVQLTLSTTQDNLMRTIQMNTLLQPNQATQITPGDASLYYLWNSPSEIKGAPSHE